MDDDFNVIDGDVGEELNYPDEDEEEREIETIVNETAGLQNSALAELNGFNRRLGKRRLCEMIEDDPSISHPLDWHMRMPLTLEENDKKRYKQLIEEEVLDRLTCKIVEARTRKSGTGRTTPSIEDEMEKDMPKGQILRFPPTDGCDWMGVSSDGNDKRFYIRMIGHGKATKKLKKAENLENRLSSLANVANEVEELKREMAARRAEMTAEEESLENSIAAGQGEEESSLWVDKYTPRGYADLVSDDTINRNLLTWLKLWDECVFRRKIDAFDQLVDEKERELYCLDSGKVRRPQHKILLLSGPAGLGKTTLAKIVARRAGYDCVEVNASDSRTVADFERVLEGAVRSSRTISATGRGRPNCLIIDEIDGAPVESIRHLIKAVQGTGKKIIRRPIVCICNNLFARALRELRPISLSVVMPPPKEDRLVERLSQISASEHLRVDHNSLLHLVQMCSCDVRHSLNALQYVAAAVKNEQRCVTLKDIKEACEHENVSNSSIFDGWSTVLELSRHIDNKRTLQNEGKRIRAIQKYVAEEGDERFVSGLHYNYPRLPLPIGTLRRASTIFLFHDEISRVVSHSQNYTVMRYEIVFYALLHLAVATHHKALLKYPQFEQLMMQRHKESQDTLASVRAQISSRRTAADLARDVLPFVVSIVQPPIKPMNEQLYGKKDREIIKEAVTIMHSFNLTYAPTMVNTQVHFIFQPSIDVLTMYDLSDVSHRVCIPNSIRQMIARQVELYRVRTEIEQEKAKSQGNRAMQAVDNARRPVEKSTGLYFHYNHGVSSAVKKNVRIYHIFP